MTSLHQYIPRLAAGAFILNSGVTKWSADAETAKGVHGMASGAYPILKKVNPKVFIKALAVGEIALGAGLVLPFVSTPLAATGLAVFSGSLLGMYVRTPGLTEKDGIRPTPNGVPVAKDVFLAGIAGGLLVDSASHAATARRIARAESKANTAKERLRAERAKARAARLKRAEKRVKSVTKR